MRVSTGGTPHGGLAHFRKGVMHMAKRHTETFRRFFIFVAKEFFSYLRDVTISITIKK